MENNHYSQVHQIHYYLQIPPQPVLLTNMSFIKRRKFPSQTVKLSPEAFFSAKKLLLKVLQYSQENTCVGVFS